MQSHTIHLYLNFRKCLYALVSYNAITVFHLLRVLDSTWPFFGTEGGKVNDQTVKKNGEILMTTC